MYYLCVKGFKCFITILKIEILKLNTKVLFCLITLDILLRFGNAYHAAQDRIKTKKMATCVVIS